MLIKLKVFPKSRKEELVDKGNLRFELYIRAEAKRGEANMRVVEVLKEKFPSALSIRIVKGHITPNKHIEIDVGQNSLGV